MTRVSSLLSLLSLRAAALTFLGVLGAFSPAGAATPAPAKKAPKIVILEVQAAEDQRATASLVGASLARAFQALHPGELITVDEAKALVDAKAQNELLGCTDPRCALDLANLLAADQIVASAYGVVGGVPQLAVTILDAREGRVMDRFSATITATEKGIDASIKPLAVRALNPGAAENGDQALKDLRTAVLLREVGPDKQDLTTTPLGACVQQGLVDAEVPVVSAMQRARLKQQLAGATGPVVDALGSLTGSDADVVVVGTVQYAKVGAVGTRVAMRAGLTFEVIKVDTGELIAAGSARPMQNAVSEETAMELAADKACGAVKQQLEAAMRRRLERGQKVIVEVPLTGTAGENGAVVADALTTELLADKQLVARARVTSVTPKQAQLELTLRGVDAVALALHWQRQGRGDRIREVSAARLVLSPSTSTAETP